MTIKCKNWDSNKSERLIGANGKQIGVLMPRIDAATLAASTGIKSHSKPGGMSKVVQHGGPHSVVDFAAHWEKHNQRTYPFAAKNTDA